MSLTPIPGHDSWKTEEPREFVHVHGCPQNPDTPETFEDADCICPTRRQHAADVADARNDAAREG